MPPPYVRHLVGNRELGRLHQIDCDETGDVGDREAIAGRIGTRRQLAVQQSQEILNAGLVGFAPRGNLRIFERFHAGMKMAKHLGHAEQKPLLEPAIPHLDDRRVASAAAEQRRLGLQCFEIAADRDRFGDHSAVIENKGWYLLQWIDRRISRSLVLERSDIDLLFLDLDALFGQEYADPPRVGGTTAVVELHGCVSSATAGI